METTTLAQGNQVLNLILQKKVTSGKFQALMESGLLSDLFDLDIERIFSINREELRIFMKLGSINKKKYVLLIRNLPPNYELVKKMMRKKFGDITVLDWTTISYENQAGQIDYNVRVFYCES